MKTLFLVTLIFTCCYAVKTPVIKYDLPEEMPIAEPGDQLEVYKRDTAQGEIIIYLRFKK